VVDARPRGRYEGIGATAAIEGPTRRRSDPDRGRRITGAIKLIEAKGTVVNAAPSGEPTTPHLPTSRRAEFARRVSYFYPESEDRFAPTWHCLCLAADGSASRNRRSSGALRRRTSSCAIGVAAGLCCWLIDVLKYPRSGERLTGQMPYARVPASRE
jgi:hypothetical protein